MREFKDDYEKRKDQNKGGKYVLIMLLASTGALVLIGMMAGLFNQIGGKFQP